MVRDAHQAVDAYRQMQNVANTELLPLAKNHLSGPIPTEAGRMTSLTKMNVIENDLSGTLPTEIGMVRHCRLLHLVHSTLACC